MTEENTGNTKPLLYFVFVNEKKELVYAGKTQDQPLTNMFQLDFTNTNFAGSDSEPDQRINTVITELQSNQTQPYTIVQQNNDFRIKYNELKKQIEIKDEEIESQNSLIQEILKQSSNEKNNDSQVCKTTIQQHIVDNIQTNVNTIKPEKTSLDEFDGRLSTIENNLLLVEITNIDGIDLGTNKHRLSLHQVVNNKEDGNCFYYALYHALEKKIGEKKSFELFDMEPLDDDRNESTFEIYIRSFMSGSVDYRNYVVNSLSSLCETVVQDLGAIEKDKKTDETQTNTINIALEHINTNFTDRTIKKLLNNIFNKYDTIQKFCNNNEFMTGIVEKYIKIATTKGVWANHIEIDFFKEYLKNKGYILEIWKPVRNKHTYLTSGDNRPTFYMFDYDNRILIYNDPGGNHFQHIVKQKKSTGGKPSSSRRKMTREKKRTTKRNLT